MLGETELFIIVIFAFLIFSPDKLPEATKTFVTTMKKMKQARNELNDVVQKEIIEPLDEIQQVTVKQLEGITEPSSSTNTKHEHEHAENKKPGPVSSSLDRCQTEEKLSQKDAQAFAYSLYDVDDTVDEKKEMQDEANSLYRMDEPTKNKSVVDEIKEDSDHE